MSFYLYDKITGEILQSSSIPFLGIEGQAGNSIELAQMIDYGTAYIKDGAVVMKPAAPDDFHRWDDVNKGWIDPRTVDDLKIVATTAIEAERDRRIMAVIVYNSHNVDGDARSQSNISAALAAVAACEATSTVIPSEQLVWRDADNRNVTFTTMADYKTWLQGLTIALTQRGTEAYAWSWTKKAALAALITPADVLAFNAIS